MKKLLALLLALIMSFSLLACGDSQTDVSSDGNGKINPPVSDNGGGGDETSLDEAVRLATSRLENKVQQLKDGIVILEKKSGFYVSEYYERVFFLSKS